ncbi:hypothetical protein [Agrococcus lahaulensis]|uniref:hypothetical protein n=1 Tax=Agrococcus lahaulensis TaxID=341722 RepID=UPI00047ABD1B|nr:hypothetical protein [Agrococcus lahaulensis]
MTNITRDDLVAHLPGDPLPRRHGKPWTEEDYRAVMRAIRDGGSLEEIAARVGRTEQGLRGQLHRILPVDERHLAADLVLPRLRQLDADGDYDWLAALAQRSPYPWETQREAETRAERGIPAFEDEELLALAFAVAVCRSSDTVLAAVRRQLGRELHRRGIDARFRQRVAAEIDSASDLLGDADPYGWPERYY